LLLQQASSVLTDTVDESLQIVILELTRQFKRGGPRSRSSRGAGQGQGVQKGRAKVKEDGQRNRSVGVRLQMDGSLTKAQSGIVDSLCAVHLKGQKACQFPHTKDG
jgi:hypothetical protein